MTAPQTGYVLNVDVQRLQATAERAEGRIQVIARPGAFVMRGEPLARLSGEAVDADAVQTAFALGRERSFDQDPRYGLIVLGEIADKALSAAVNDIGTVVGVIGSGVRLLDLWAETTPDERAPCDRVLAEPLSAEDLLDDIFGPVVRHGAHDLTSAVRLRKALTSLSVHPVLSKRRAGHGCAADAGCGFRQRRGHGTAAALRRRGRTRAG